MKPTKAWAVKYPSGMFGVPYMGWTRIQAICAFETFTGGSWRKLKRQGYSCVKVEVREPS